MKESRNHKRVILFLFSKITNFSNTVVSFYIFTNFSPSNKPFLFFWFNCAELTFLKSPFHSQQPATKNAKYTRSNTTILPQQDSIVPTSTMSSPQQHKHRWPIQGYIYHVAIFLFTILIFLICKEKISIFIHQ